MSCLVEKKQSQLNHRGRTMNFMMNKLENFTTLKIKKFKTMINGEKM